MKKEKKMQTFSENHLLHRVPHTHKSSQHYTMLCTMQVEGVCKGILHMLGSLTGEYAELLTRLAVDQEPLQIGHELHVGQLLVLLSLFASLSSSFVSAY